MGRGPARAISRRAPARLRSDIAIRGYACDPEARLTSRDSDAVTPDPLDFDARPRLRGVLHVWAFFASLIALGVLVIERAPLPLPALLFALSVSGLFATSALYHRVRWSPAWYPRIRRVDHAMIFVLIMGSYAPLFAAVEGRGLEAIFVTIYAVASVGILMTLLWTTAPKWARAAVYLVVGWMCVILTPDVFDALGASGLAMLFVGGALYSVGAVIYALKRPDPLPGIFGYHEIFHALVIAAVASHFVLVRFWIFP